MTSRDKASSLLAPTQSSSSDNTLASKLGKFERLSVIFLASLSDRTPRSSPQCTAIVNNVTSCVVKALVEATDISGPASVFSTVSDSRAIVLSGTLTRLMIFCPFSLA